MEAGYNCRHAKLHWSGLPNQPILPYSMLTHYMIRYTRANKYRLCHPYAYRHTVSGLRTRSTWLLRNRVLSSVPNQMALCIGIHRTDYTLLHLWRYNNRLHPSYTGLLYPFLFRRFLLNTSQPSLFLSAHWCHRWKWTVYRYHWPPVLRPYILHWWEAPNKLKIENWKLKG